MANTRVGLSIPEVDHHHIDLDGVDLHYVSAGSTGSTVLLVHGFPETWWCFHKLIPLLATKHRVLAVDLPGFGDSGSAPEDATSGDVAQILGALIEYLELGAVHLTGQDISGVATFRLAAARPDLIRSFAAIETGLPGFGLEALADVTHGGAWHIGVLAAPGIPEMLLASRERAFLADYAFPTMTVAEDAVSDRDLNEFARAYARPDGFRGASNLYRCMLHEGEDIRQLAARNRLTMPVLAVGAGSGDFTYATMTQVAERVRPATLPDVGHYVAMEAPEALTKTLLDFYSDLDAP